MDNYFPYEEKMIKEAMNLIDKDKVQEFSGTEDDKVMNYLIVYSQYSNRFYGIYASHFLKGNFASATIIKDPEDIKYYLKRVMKTRLIKNQEVSYNHFQLFNYEEYLKLNENDGFDILEKYDSCTFDLKNRIVYAAIYLEYPNIKDYVEQGYYKLVEEMLNDYSTASTLLENNIEDMQIDEQCKEYLKDKDNTAYWWINLDRINKIDNISIDQLKYMYENDFSIETVCSLIKAYEQYTVSSLLDYVSRCVMYQGYEPRRVIDDLYGYINGAEKYLVNIDYYPNDLAKAYKFVYSLYTKYDTLNNINIINNYQYNYKNRNRLYFKDDNYYIKAENNIDNVRNKGRLFFLYDISLTTYNDIDCFWLCDAKTNKEIAIIRTSNSFNKKQLISNVRKYNDMPLSHKEKTFMKKWFEYRKNINLSLTKPQYNIV